MYLINREKHTKKLAIVALKWNPKANGEIAYADIEGQLGLLEVINLQPSSSVLAQVCIY